MKFRIGIFDFFSNWNFRVQQCVPEVEGWAVLPDSQRLAHEAQVHRGRDYAAIVGEFDLRHRLPGTAKNFGVTHENISRLLHLYHFPSQVHRDCDYATIVGEFDLRHRLPATSFRSLLHENISPSHLRSIGVVIMRHSISDTASLQQLFGVYYMRTFHHPISGPSGSWLCGNSQGNSISDTASLQQVFGVYYMRTFHHPNSGPSGSWICGNSRGIWSPTPPPRNKFSEFTTWEHFTIPSQVHRVVIMRQ